jgi:hypothetical protein
MMELTGLAVWTACAGTSVSSPAAEVKRTLNESPYMSAVATTLRRGAIANGLPTFIQAIVCLHPVLALGVTLI